jgi:DNA-binding transcriptional MerR regulator
MASNIILKRVGGAELDGGGRKVYKDWHFWVQFSPKMSSSVENMSIADIEKLLELRKEQDRKAEEERKRQEKEDHDRKEKERRDRERAEMEEELAKAAKELEEEMGEELDWAGDVDATPRAWRDLFRDSEEDEDSDEEEDLEPDKTSKDPKEKEWVVAHKETKSAKIHLATARGNLTTVLYKHGYAPSEAADKMLVQWRGELQSAIVRLRTARVQDAMLTTSDGGGWWRRLRWSSRRRRMDERGLPVLRGEKERRRLLLRWRHGAGPGRSATPVVTPRPRSVRGP